MKPIITKIGYLIVVLISLTVMLACPEKNAKGEAFTVSDAFSLQGAKDVIYGGEKAVVLALPAVNGNASSSAIAKMVNLAKKSTLVVTEIATGNINFKYTALGGVELKLPVSIPPGGKFAFEIHFTPSYAGKVTSNMNIKAQFKGFEDSLKRVVIPISCSADGVNGGRGNTGIGLVGTNVNKYDFFQVAIGSSSEYPIVLENVYSLKQAVSIYEVVSTSKAFVVSGISKYIDLNFGEKKNFFISFKPFDDSYLEEKIIIYTSLGRFDFKVVGKGTLSPNSVFKIKLNENDLEAGAPIHMFDQVIGTTGEKYFFDIKNEGIGNLKIVNITSNLSTDFILSVATLPINLSYGKTLRFSIQFKPSIALKRKSALTILYNAGKVFTIAPEATGIPVGSADLQILDSQGKFIEINDDISLPSTIKNDTSSSTYTLLNSGDMPLIIDSFINLFTDKLSVVVPSIPFSIEPGKKETMLFNFSPVILGKKLMNIQLNTNSYEAGENHFAINLTGFCIDSLPLLPPVIEAIDVILDNRTPTWNFKTAQGSTGSGTFRYALDNQDLENNGTETTEKSFTPTVALSDGDHTLYVQEKDVVGTWSLAAFHKINVDFDVPEAPTVTPFYDLKKGTVFYESSNKPGASWIPANVDDASGYRISFDNGANYTEVGVANYTSAIAVPDGVKSIIVQTKDVHQRYGKKGFALVTVDTTGPVIDLNLNDEPIKVETPPNSGNFLITYAGTSDLLIPKSTALTYADYDRGATVTDSVFGDSSSTLTVNSASLDMTLAGVYSVTYSAHDELNNQTVATRKVYVTDLNNLEFEWSLDQIIWQDKDTPEANRFKIKGAGSPNFFLRVKESNIAFQVRYQVTLTWTLTGADTNTSSNFGPHQDNSLNQHLNLEYSSTNPNAVENKKITLNIGINKNTGSSDEGVYTTETNLILPIWPQ